MNLKQPVMPIKIQGSGFLLATLLMSALPAMAATFSLNAGTGAPLYRSELPVEVYQYTQRDDLSDLIINNGAGEQVPHTLLARSLVHPLPAEIKHNMTLPIFALQADALNTGTAGTEQLRLQLEKSGGKTTISINQGINSDSQAAATLYLLDAGQQHADIQSLTFDWLPSTSSMLALEVLASDDLNRWSPVGRGILLKASNASGSLVQNSITLDRPSSARYLQVRGVNPAQVFTLTRAVAQTASLAVDRPKLLWQALGSPKRSDDSQSGRTLIEFEAYGHFPAESLRIALPQDNTITSVIISVRNKPGEPWRYVTSASSYRMVETKPDGQRMTVSNPDISITPTVARYWQLQFNNATGGISAASPALSLGWPTQTMVWNARGSAPFTLKTDDNAGVNQVTIASLIPDFKEDNKAQKLAALPAASIQLQVTKSAPTVSSSWDKPADRKQWWLWAGLVLGVLVLAGMALSLLKTSTPPEGRQ